MCARVTGCAVCKVECILEVEYAEGEAALDSARIKLQQLQQKYDLDVNKERDVCVQLREELATVRSKMLDKTQEYKRQETEVENMREQVSSYHDRIVHLKRQLEECSIDLVSQRAVAMEYQHKARQAEVAMNDLIAVHRREKLELEQEVIVSVENYVALVVIVHAKVRKETEKRMESDKRHLEQRSDVYRLHYQNQYSSMRSASLRDMGANRSSFTEQSVHAADMRSEEPAVCMDDSIDIEQLVRERNELLELLREHRLLHSEEIVEWKKKFDMAGANISRLKAIVEKTSDESLNLRNIIQQMKDTELNHSKRRIDDDMGTNFYPEKERKLKAEIDSLKKALIESEDQARRDQEDDTLLLQEMKDKFDALMVNYQNSCADRDEEIRRQKEEIISLESVVSEIKASYVRSDERLKSLLVEVANKDAEISHHADAISEKDLELSEKSRTIHKLQNDYQERMKHVSELTTDRENFEKRVAEESKLTADYKKTITKLQRELTDHESRVTQCRDREKYMHTAIVRLHSQLNDIKLGNEMVRSEFAAQLSDVQEEARRSVNCISGFVRMVLSKSQFELIDKQNDIGSTKSYSVNRKISNDLLSLESSLSPAKHGDSLVKTVLEAMLDCGVLTQGSFNEIMIAATPVLLNPSQCELEMAVLSGRVYDKIVESLTAYSGEKTQLQNQVSLMSDELRLARLSHYQRGFDSADGKSEYTSILDTSEISSACEIKRYPDELMRWKEDPSNSSSSRDHSLSEKEYASEIRRLRNHISDQNSRHRSEIER
jgi:hypothetical protein